MTSQVMKIENAKKLVFVVTLFLNCEPCVVLTKTDTRHVCTYLKTFLVAIQNIIKIQKLFAIFENCMKFLDLSSGVVSIPNLYNLHPQLFSSALLPQSSSPVTQPPLPYVPSTASQFHRVVPTQLLFTNQQRYSQDSDFTVYITYIHNLSHQHCYHSRLPHHTTTTAKCTAYCYLVHRAP